MFQPTRLSSAFSMPCRFISSISASTCAKVQATCMGGSVSSVCSSTGVGTGFQPMRMRISGMPSTA